MANTKNSPFYQFATSTLSDVFDTLGISGIITGLHPVTGNTSIAGRAYTIKETTSRYGEYNVEEFRIGHAIDGAKHGDIIVIDNDAPLVSTWGFLTSLSAKSRKVKGTVVNGAVRDIDEIEEIRFPLFAREISALSGKSRIKITDINVPITIQGVRITPGDLVVADSSGVAVVPQAFEQQVLREATRLEAIESSILPRLKKGDSLTHIVADKKHI